ncbi:MAG: hypothetical protein K8R68_09210 [Bacteroidales bacterium]|nr:hypothetical protein [Bacteroidales bacterium]
MKTLTKIIAVLLLIIAPFFLTAQPQPLDENVSGWEGANPIGKGTHVTGGLLIIFSLGFGYSAKKVYDIRKGVVE